MFYTFGSKFRPVSSPEEEAKEERKGSSQEKRLEMSRARGGNEQKENKQGKKKIERNKIRPTCPGPCATVSTKPVGMYCNFRKSSTKRDFFAVNEPANHHITPDRSAHTAH